MTTPPPVPVERTTTCAGCGAEIAIGSCSWCDGLLCPSCCSERGDPGPRSQPQAPAEPANPECSTVHSPFLDSAAIDAAILKMVHDRNLAVDALTESMLAEAIRQALLSGEFMKHVRVDGKGQSITYLPWSETERLRDLYNELLNAVGREQPNESSHEAALRIIRENYYGLSMRQALPAEAEYHDLLFAVARVFPGETRHQTALRYIREAEDRAVESEPKDATANV